MKRFFATAVSTLLVGNIFAGDIGSMMKEKARGFGGQNNAQPGGAPASPSQPTAPAAPQLTPAQQALVQLINGLGGIKAPATAEQSNALAADLMGVARGATKPSGPAVNKLAKGLTAALAGKTLTGTPRSRLAVDLQTALTGVNVSGVPVSATQMEAIIADVPAILKKIGAEAKDADAVAEDLKSIVEARNKAAK